MAGEYLTLAEIEARFPNEWVLIDRPRNKRGSLELLGGYVVWHSPDRGEFDRRLGDVPVSDRIAVRYTGKPDPNELLFLNLDP
jgi:hypothetical protein